MFLIKYVNTTNTRNVGLADYSLSVAQNIFVMLNIVGL
jgi:hypothetical protein